MTVATRARWRRAGRREYVPDVVRRLLGPWVLVAALGAPAAAGVELGTLSPRAIGHAGASLVSDDGAAAVFQCPAAIARRDTRRAQLAGVALDDEVVLLAPGHPRVGDVSGASVMPLVGAAGHLGEFVLAVALATTERLDHQLPVPRRELPTTEIAAQFPHRYDGLAAHQRRQSLGVAAALRPTEWLAIGATITLSQVELEERRRLWAGFAGRDPLAQPGRDIDVTLAAGDGLVPGAALGALIAPLDTPLELALGVAWSDDVRADGDVTATAASDDAATVIASAPHTTTRHGSALTTAVGVRWLGERYAVEGAATWTAYPTGSDPWSITNLELIDESGVRAAVRRLPTRLPRRGHGATQHRQRTRQTHFAKEHRRDHTRHRRHGGNAEINFATQKHKRNPRRDDRQCRDLGQNIAQIDIIEKTVGEDAKKEHQDHQRGKGRQVARPTAHPSGNIAAGGCGLKRYSLVHGEDPLVADE